MTHSLNGPSTTAAALGNGTEGGGGSPSPGGGGGGPITIVMGGDDDKSLLEMMESPQPTTMAAAAAADEEHLPLSPTHSHKTSFLSKVASRFTLHVDHHNESSMSRENSHRTQLFLLVFFFCFGC